MSKDRFKANPNDLIILVMGPKGSGKTNFIKNVTGNVKQKANQSKLDVQGVTPYTISREDNRRIVLVDTPGFDDDYRLDSEIIKIVANWLKQKYAPRGRTLSLTGIIYLHRIIDSHMPRSTYEYLQIFAQLCGNMPLPRVHLVMTMWDIVDKKLAEEREGGLKRLFWQELLQVGATAFRFDNHPRSAQTIIEPLFGLKSSKGTDGHFFAAGPKDIIIGVMGPTGSGKANFIGSVTGTVGRHTAGHLNPHTRGVIPYITTRDGRRVVLIDMPGFEDIYADIGSFKVIANWLTQEYSPGGGVLRLAGIVYLHPITCNRMSDSDLKNLKIFGQICGDIFLPQVCLVTTMWDTVKDKHLAERRETQLRREFWHRLLQGGATASRFDNRPDSALAIIDSFLGITRDREMLLLQEELFAQRKHLKETSLGRYLYPMFQRLLVEQRRTLKELANEANQRHDPAIAQALQEEHDKVSVHLRKMMEQMKEMEIPFTRRASLWLSGKKSRARAIGLNNAPS